MFLWLTIIYMGCGAVIGATVEEILKEQLPVKQKLSILFIWPLYVSFFVVLSISVVLMCCYVTAAKVLGKLII